MIRKCLLGLLLLTPLGFYPFLRDTTAYIEDRSNPPPINPLTHDQQIVLSCLAILPGQSFPAALPWEPFRDIGEGQSATLEKMAEADPIAFLEYCMTRYEENIRGYRCIFVKQEKVNGKLREKEKLRCAFTEKPFSVYMRWLEGIELAEASMYVEGQNDGKLLARSMIPFTGIRGPVLSRPVNALDVKSTSRFPITEFGIHKGAKSTVDAMRAAQERDALYVTYEGIQRIEQLGNRPCYVFVRSPYTPPEADNVNELTIYIDTELLMQTGSILRDPDGNLIAEYFFRDIELNPTFDEKQFTRGAL